MRIFVDLHPGAGAKVVDLPPDAKGMDLVRSLGLPPDVHILVRGEVPIPEDEGLIDGERIRVIGVVSGG